MPAPRVREIAAAFVLGLHALLALWLLFEDRTAPRFQDPERRLVTLRIHLPPLPPQAAQVEMPDPTIAPARNAELPVPPATAPPLAVETPANGRPEEEAAPRVDWHGEAARLAASAAERSSAADTFGPPVQKMREPCMPRESSFKWNPEEEKYGLLPIPYVIIADRCVVTIGGFGCALGSLPEPNHTLFDDMREGKTSPSSVPDPNRCD